MFPRRLSTVATILRLKKGSKILENIITIKFKLKFKKEEKKNGWRVFWIGNNGICCVMDVD